MTATPVTLTREAPSEAPMKTRPLSPARLFVKAYLRNRVAVIALVVLTVLVLASVFSPVLPLQSPTHLVLRDRLQGPSWSHLVGTDELGRDELARLLAAARISLWAAVQATVVGVVLGVPLGLLMGYLGGRADSIISRAFDALQSIPPLILAIAVVAALGRNLTPAMLAIGIVFSVTFYRVGRAVASSVASETFVEASRSMGQTTAKIVGSHVLGNVASPLIVQVSTTLAFGILAEASLSFLGLGVQPPAASLGSMLTTAANALNTAPRLVVLPGLVIVILVLCISLIGDAIRDASAGEGHI